MKNKIKLILTVFVSMLFIGNVDAASFSISVGSRTLNPGGSTTLRITGSDVTGRFNITTSNGSVISISDGSVWVENNTQTIKLSSLNIGSATITVSPVSGTSDSSGNPVTLGAKSVTISVQKPRDKSKDNNLKSLSVEGFTLNEEFSKDKLEYTVDVPEGTTSINIIAPSNDGYATITGAGIQTVNPGANNFDIVVTPELGEAKTYKLVVNVIDQNPVEVTIDKLKYTLVKYENAFTCPDNFEAITIEIGEFKVPACQNDKIKYTLVGLKNEDGTVILANYKNNKYTLFNEIKNSNQSIVPLKFKGSIKNYAKSSVKINGLDVECYKYTKYSKTCIIYALNVDTGKENYYVYDTENKNYIAYDNEYIDYLETNNKYMLIACISFAAGLFISFVSLICVSKKKKKKNNSIKENKTNIEEKPVKEEVKKKEKIENKKEEIDTEEVYNIFEDEKKSKKKNKVK